MTINKHQTHPSLTTRSEFIALLDSAILVGSYRFARQITLTWLAYYPGDLPVRYRYGKLLIEAGQSQQAIQIISELCLADPEYIEAWKLLETALSKTAKNISGSDHAFYQADCHSAINALGGRTSSTTSLPAWSNGVLQTRQALAQGDLEVAEKIIHQVLVVNPLPPLLAITHLKYIYASDHPEQTLQNLANYYRLQFPNTILPGLLLADSLIDGGSSEKAVAMLHQSATLDITGQIPNRLWITGNPYAEIWPENPEAPLDIPIPAEVAAQFGRNRLPQISIAPSLIDDPKLGPLLEADQGFIERSDPEQPVAEDSLPSVIALGGPKHKVASRKKKSGTKIRYDNRIPESLLSVQAELERLASNLKLKQLAKKDGRFPVYIIFTTRQGLLNQYGHRSVERLDHEMRDLINAISSRNNWRAILVYADDPECMSTYGLSPAESNDPWSLKLALIDLDKSLAKKGEMIGAVLIVGGPEIVPFHNLPNPVDDIDNDVPSDNPYSTRDENYFVPEWPVGRLPGGIQRDVEPLIKAIKDITEYHSHLYHSRNPLQRLWDRIRHRLSFFARKRKSSLGYTAAIWRRASLSVFRPIGAPHTMLVSPPLQANDDVSKKKKNQITPNARLGYFNLHGLEDSSYWYGQRDPSDLKDMPDYPIALRPQDVVNGGKAPQVVFSEACYGANIVNKNIEEALALKFINSGSLTVVGSTCTSYGSITTPLIAADLLGHAFWKFLREGLPSGEALRRAKIHLAKEMHHRQGFLDGEDQKTLISFVLYGDPLAEISSSASPAIKVLRPMRKPAQLKTVCDRSGNCRTENENTSHTLQNNPPLPEQTLVQVKQIVEQYLPGMTDAKVNYSQTHATCSGKEHACPTSHRKSSTPFDVNRNVVTLSKQVIQPSSSTGTSHTHRHYARLTVDEHGKVIKLVVSR